MVLIHIWPKHQAPENVTYYSVQWLDNALRPSKVIPGPRNSYGPYLLSVLCAKNFRNRCFYPPSRGIDPENGRLKFGMKLDAGM